MENQKIIKLANELMAELIKQGYDLQARSEHGTIPGYLDFDVAVYDAGECNKLTLGNVVNEWEIKGKCTVDLPAQYTAYLEARHEA